MRDTDIAVVGMAGCFPGAPTIDQYWQNLANGVDSIIDAPPNRIDPVYFEWDPTAYDRLYCKRGGFCDEIFIDPVRYGFLPIAAQKMDPEHMLVMKFAYEALEDAGVFEKNISLKNACAILGKGNFASASSLRNIDLINTSAQIVEVVKQAIPGIPAEDLDKIKREFQQAKGLFTTDNAIAMMPNLVASLMMNRLDMHGPAYTIDGACASSIMAVYNCIELLLNGQCDIALAGGLHAGQTAMFWSSFTMLGALSHKGEISPFSETADGLLIGEGGGVLVLKKLKKAIEDEDRIYAIINGTGVYSDGSGVSVMAPNTQGQQKAIGLAWKRAGMDPRNIGMIEAHGTATIVGDRTEINTLNEFFGKDPSLSKAYLGSVKSNIGHTMAAAGMAGMIKAILSLYHRKIVPTLHTEKPAKALHDSRFILPQTAIDWDDSTPLVAGVNAFGFGGINSHAIFTAYEKRVKPTATSTITAESETVIAIGAQTKDALLKKLAEKDYSIVNGDYRLIVFNPTEERLEKAKKLIEKDKPWKGRMDIWFSNKPLLKKDGKIAFLFPGFDPDVNAEIDSVIERFNLAPMENLFEENPMLAHTLKLYQKNKRLNTALRKLNVTPDMYAGHSIGEWHAAEAAGFIPDETPEKLFKAWMDPSVERGDDYAALPDVHFVAVGCGYERLKPLIEGIEDLYLSNDNCPNQILMCGTPDATEKMGVILNKEQIFFQILPYKSGYHTPFIANQMKVLDDSIKHIEIKEPETPMWSATSLELYPTNMTELRKLNIQHLTTHIRFRELIEKLYEQEKARVFIQIGAGGVTGFINDTLKDKDYSAISASSSNLSGVDQLKRVLALLFIEGHNINYTFVGIKPQKSSGNEMELQQFSLIIEDLPAVREAARKYGGAAINSLFDEVSDRPIIQAMNDGMKEMASVQKEMVELYKEVEQLDKTFGIEYSARPKKDVNKVTKDEIKDPKKNKNFNEEMIIPLKDYPFLVDHTIVKQPDNWPHLDDIDVVIPMTMTIELMAEMAQKQSPEKKVTSLIGLSVFQWMNVYESFNQTVKGSWKSEDTISLNMNNFVSTDVKLEDEFPAPPAEYVGNIDLGKKIQEPPTKAEVYEELMFHGPKYQGVNEITEFNERGLKASVQNAGGKGSLLDTMGQLIGIYLHKTVDVNHISFPVKVGEINFYQDFHDQEGIFEFTLVTKEITDEFIIGDMIIKRDGKIWCVAKDWLNHRFEVSPQLWKIIQTPLENKLAKELSGDHITYFDLAYSKTGSWGFLEKRYLNYQEKQHHKGLLLNKRKEYLISRIAIKDAIRAYLEDRFGRKTYPVEIFIEYDDNGKPHPKGLEELENVEISLSHKGNESVAIASDKPVGIDLEQIEERSSDFIEMSFTENELKLIKGKDMPEWTTRLWVAKEAYGKMLGVGLVGNPKQYEIKSIDGEILHIGDTKIRTTRHKENFIAGWTL